MKMTDNFPLVTLAMPAYNSEEFIRQSIDSLLAQDFPSFELVISDNASTDGTGEICRAYARKDQRIRYIRQPRNIGAVANWNFLVHCAKGRYFRWSSSNDLCAPQMLRLCVEALEADASLVLCQGRTSLIDDQGTVIEQYRHDHEFLDEKPSRRFRRVCTEMHLNNAQSAVIRLEMLRRTGLERNFPEGDMVLMSELALHGGFRVLPEVLFYRRMGRKSATQYLDTDQKVMFRDPGKIGEREYTTWPTAFSLMRSIGRSPAGWWEGVLSRAFVLRQLWWSRRSALHELLAWCKTAGASSKSAAPSAVVALLGAYSSRNFGDVAIQKAAIHNLRVLCPGVTLVGISHDASDTLEHLGIAGWNLQAGEGIPDDPRAELGMGWPRLLARRLARFPKMLRIAGSVDILVVSGSGQLEDYWGGPMGHAWSLLAWTVAFRLRRRKVAILATGLDDLTTSLGKRFIRATLRFAQYRSFRDSGTLEEMRRLGFGGAAHVCPDLAFSLPEQVIPAPTMNPAGAPSILVCPIAQRAFRKLGAEVYDEYLEGLRKVCVALAEEGCTIVLTNSQTDMDMPLLSRFADSLATSGMDGQRIRVRPSSSLSDYLAAVAASDVVVASRLHGVILSIISCTPVVAISYSRKVEKMMADVGLERNCLHLREFDPRSALDLIHATLGAQAEYKSHLKVRVEAFRNALKAEYENVMDLLDGSLHRSKSHSQ